MCDACVFVRLRLCDSIRYFESVYGEGLAGVECAGLFYTGSGRALGAAILFAAFDAAWVGITTGAVASLLMRFNLHRVSPADEIAGLDDSKHGGRIDDTPISIEGAGAFGVVSIRDAPMPLPLGDRAPPATNGARPCHQQAYSTRRRAL